MRRFSLPGVNVRAMLGLSVLLFLTAVPAASQPVAAVPETGDPNLPATGELAYSIKRGDHWDIWVHDFATGANVQLTDDPTSDQWAPAYSHDGTRLAYLSDATDGSNQVWLMNPDGSDQRQVTNHTGDSILYVAWSSDNQEFIVSVQGPSGKRLMRVSVTGGELREYIPAPSSFATTATYGRLVYVTDVGERQELRVGGFLGGESFSTLSAEVNLDTPSLRKDGLWMAYAAGPAGERRINLLQTNQGRFRGIGTSGGDDSFPTWVLDGEAVAHVATLGGVDSIRVVTFDTEEETYLDLPPHDQLWYLAGRPGTEPSPTSADTASNQEPQHQEDQMDQSPDLPDADTVVTEHAPLPLDNGDQSLIAFRMDGNIHVMNVDGSNIQPVTTRGIDPWAPHQAPYPHSIYPWFEWSADGRYLLIVQDEHVDQGPANRSLLVLDAESEALRILADVPATIPLNPSWAFDSHEIAFVTAMQESGMPREPATYSVSVVDLDGNVSPLIDVATLTCGPADGYGFDPAINLHWREVGFPFPTVMPHIQWSRSSEFLVISGRCGLATLADLSNGNVTQLDVAFPVITPDGRFVAKTELLGADLAVGTLLDQDWHALGSGALPIWSPDGQTAYFSRVEQPYDSLSNPFRLQPADGSGVPQILSMNTSQLWQVSVEGGDPTMLLEQDTHAFGRPSVTPDGRSLIFTAVDNSIELWENRLPGDTYSAELVEQYGPGIRIQRLDLETGEVTTLAEHADRPAVQPSGDLVALPPVAPVAPDPVPDEPSSMPVPAEPQPIDGVGLIAYTGDDGNIWVMNPDGSEQRPLTTGGTPDNPFRNPRWSPDGAMLVFDGSEAGQSAILMYRDGQISRLPNVYGCRAPTFMPDGQRLAFACSEGATYSDAQSDIDLQSTPALGYVSTSNLDGSDWRVLVPYSFDDYPMWIEGRRLWVNSLEISASDGAVLINSFGMLENVDIANADGSNGNRLIDSAIGTFAPDGHSLIAAQCEGVCYHNQGPLTVTFRQFDRAGNVEADLLAFSQGVRTSAPSLSPDGTALVYFATDTQSNAPGGIYIAAIPGGAPVLLTETPIPWNAPAWQPVPVPIDDATTFVQQPAPESEAEQPVAPAPVAAGLPASGQLAYAARVGEHWDIYLHDFATGTSTPLTSDPFSDQWAPAWSPDGSQIAFLSDAADGSNQIWVMDSTGGNPYQVTAYYGGEVYYVAWAPDNQTLIFTVAGGGIAWLMAVPATGGEPRMFVPAPASHAAVAPDGRFAYVTVGGPKLDIILADPDGAALMVLAATGESEDIPSFSPDGATVAYNVGERGNRRIMAVSANGGEPWLVTAAFPDQSNPVWSPDGALLAFVATENGIDQIVLVSLSDSSTLIPLDAVPHNRLWYLAWRP